MAAQMWRVPVSVVKQSGKFGFVQDNGVMQSAPPGSKGWHLFSEKGAGVKGLALIGAWHEVLNWLAVRPGTGIDNLIADLPEIYMGVGIYKPGDRFVGCFPVGDAIVQIVKGVADFAPGNTITDVGSIVAFGVEKGTEALKATKKPNKPNVANAPAMITFHYLPGKGMHLIGKGKMSYGDIYPLVLKGLSDLV